MRYLLAILLCCVVLRFLPLNGYAEAEVYDYSDSLSDYAQAVAFLNRPLPMPNTLPEGEGQESCLAALMCRTDGTEVDFAPASALYILAGPEHCFTLFFETAQERDAAVALLNRTEGVRYAEADCDVYSCEETERSFQSWGAAEMGFGAYADYVDPYRSGSTVVAVVDSGCYPHPAMQGRILSGAPDYVDGDLDSSNDLFGHGTNVAGIIADCTQNMPVYLYPIRVLNDYGRGKMSNVVNAVRLAATTASVINLSLESSNMSQSLDDAIREAVSSGVTVVVAAGNSACDTSAVCPAHLADSGVIVVGSAEGSGEAFRRASYSNYGSSVDVYAFGSGIQCCAKNGGYTVNSGTSMAAPHISSVCALMRLLHPELSPSQMEQRLRAAAEDEKLPIPQLSQMIPQAVSFSLSDVRLWTGGTLTLPPALPASACEKMHLSSSDESIVSCKGSTLTALACGIADITVSCRGLEDTVFRITVTDVPESQIRLPEFLTAIEAEAFFGNSSIRFVAVPSGVQHIGSSAFDSCRTLSLIRIPSSVTEIADNTFSGAAILCQYGSTIHEYAQEHQLQYIAFSDLTED